MSIYFSGTVDTTDAGRLVNLMVFNPTGTMVLITGKIADANGTFQIAANTNDPSQFGGKGIYKATAFVNSESTGRTIYFDFSPDGSPVAHPQSGVEGTSPGGTETSASQQGGKIFKSVIAEDLSSNDLANMSMGQGIFHSVSGGPHPLGISDVIYPAMAACGAAIVGFVLYNRSRPRKETTPEAKPGVEGTEEEDYAMQILKNRLAKGEITLEEFKATRDALAEP